MTGRDWSLILVLGMLWGGSFFFARVAVQEIVPLHLVFFRVSIAALALHVYLLIAGPDFRIALPMAGSFVALGLLNNIIPFSLMFAGQTELGAGAASILNATTPFWTMALAGLLTDDERLSGMRLAGLALGLAGTATMVGPGLAADLGGPAWAKLALLGMALSYGFAFVFARRFRHLPPQVVATGQLTASTLMMVPVVLFGTGTRGLFSATPHVWAAVLGLALLATALAYIIYFAVIRSAGASNASLVTLLVPVNAILLGTLFLGERLEWFEIAGMALIGLGLLVIDGRILRRR
jgi:drug/metabolite transporter (DMT)-like permease